MIHKLKILPEYFEAVRSGAKNFEIRLNDRDFQLHDELILREFDGEHFTGRRLHRWIGYIYRGDGRYGLSDGYCVLALKRSPPNAVLDREEM